MADDRTYYDSSEYNDAVASDQRYFAGCELRYERQQLDFRSLAYPTWHDGTHIVASGTESGVGITVDMASGIDGDIPAGTSVIPANIRITASVPFVATIYSRVNYVSCKGKHPETGKTVYWFDPSGWVGLDNVVSAPSGGTVEVRVWRAKDRFWTGLTLPEKFNFEGNEIVSVHFATGKLFHSATDGRLLRSDDAGQLLCDM